MPLCFPLCFRNLSLVGYYFSLQVRSKRNQEIRKYLHIHVWVLVVVSVGECFSLGVASYFGAGKLFILGDGCRFYG